MGRSVVLRAPGSKSQTQRAMIIGALAQGETRLHDACDCDDSRHLSTALQAMGINIQREGNTWTMGGGTWRVPPGPLWCGDAGTALRFLAPLALLLPGPVTLDGSAQLRARPVTALLDALRGMGVQVEHPGDPGCLPLRLQRGSKISSEITVDVTRSSQFASGLLMVAPLLRDGLNLTLDHGHGPIVSKPYLDLTVQVMEFFGATVNAQPGGFQVAPGAYRPRELTIETDWSAAAFLLAAGWIRGRGVEVEGLTSQSVQGDRVMVDFLQELDFPRVHCFDLADCPDLLAPLAAACAFATHPSQIVRVEHARLKESDRIAVLATELNKAGVKTRECRDGLEIIPGGTLRSVELDPHGDHRMAMAFGLLSLREPGIRVTDPACVAKSFPDFWNQLERLK